MTLTSALRKKILFISAGCLVLVLLIAGVAAALIYPTLPDLAELSDYRPKMPLRIYTADGQLMAEYGAERRDYLPLDKIPKRMQNALLAVEDEGFYEHGAVSYSGMARAAINDLIGRHLQGASTITQQLARDFYLTKKRGDWSRKFVEILLSHKMEATLSKQQILEIYMNQIYLGSRAYGFAAASRIYFAKPLEQLSIAETAMLAGLPQNPYYVNPISNLRAATRRQHVVLLRMRETGMISEAEEKAAREEPLHVRSGQDARMHAEYVAEMARQVVVAQYGEESYNNGLKVTTTVVAAEQEAAYRGLRRALMDLERRKPYRGPEGTVDMPDDPEDEDAAISKGLAEHPDNDELRAAVVTQAAKDKILATLHSGDDIEITGEGLHSVQGALSANAKKEIRVARGSIIRVLKSGSHWVVAQAPEAEGAFVSMEPGTGRIHALVGGFDFARNKFNHVMQAWRQPGSSFKPLVYSAALEQGLTPSTIVNDAPITIGDWEPKNYENTYDGPMTVRAALAKSKNLVTVRVMQMLGAERARAWAVRFGLDADKLPNNLTLGLGSGSVTPMQMVAAYSVFANAGLRTSPLLITRITDADDKVLFDAETAKPAASASDAASDATGATDERRAISERNAFVIANLLQEVARSGTAARAQATLHRPDLYGKTGTTNESVDAWFAGFQPSLAAVVWIGYDQPRSLGDRESGGGLALPVWIDAMSVALRNVPVHEIQPPSEGLVMSNGDWSFEEFAGDAGIRSLGMDSAPPAPASSASQ
ncbi:MAG: PBP1A family penicillin-binding protein [Paucibacter sp.]|nr:PBP1A family penicillin-binding protein [Roseateles sp.]